MTPKVTQIIELAMDDATDMLNQGWWNEDLANERILALISQLDPQSADYHRAAYMVKTCYFLRTKSLSDGQYAPMGNII